MVREGILSAAVGAAIASVIGALASLFVERAWRRRKAKQQKPHEEP
jgi:hypothetical protein